MSSIINATTTAGVTVTGDNSGSLQLATNNGTTAVTITTAQDVGIGTSSPSTKLHVEQSTTGDAFKVARGGNYLIMGGSGSGTQYVKGFEGIVAFGNAFAGNTTFLTGDTERMRIDSSGRLLVGTTSTSSFDEGFRANPTGSGNSMQVIISNTGGGLPFLLNRSDDGNIIDFRRAGSNVGTVSVTTSSTSYNTSSDYRLKEDIAPMTGALAKVAQLKPVTYTWKATGETSQGFIAHELQAVVPDCVTGEKDAIDEEGNPVHQGIDTSFLVATLTAALQEAHGLIKDLQARVETLEAK